MKHGMFKIIGVLLAILAVGIFTRTLGPLDTYPRVSQTQKSSDGAWEFEVRRRKLAAFSPLADSEIVFRVRDVRGGRVSEQRIWRTSWPILFEYQKKHSVRFEPNEIIVDDFWVMNKADLEFRMCPLLECLKQPE